MQSYYPTYIDPNTVLLVGLISLGYDTTYDTESSIRVNISDYVLLKHWLGIAVKTDVDNRMGDLPKGRLTGLSFVLKDILNCSEGYIAMHIDYYNYTNIKEYFYEYQQLKHYISSN